MAAIAMALVSVGVAGAAMVSFMLSRSQETQADTLGQAQVLAWADKAVRSFALANGRLPCPAAVQNGVEACSGAVKGWLPVASLARVVPDFDPNVTPDALASMRIRYLVSHGPSGAGSASDISAPSAAFSPTLENGKALSGYPGYIPPPRAEPSTGPLILGTMDICAKLLTLRKGWDTYVRTVMIDDQEVKQLMPRRWRIAPDQSPSDTAAPVAANQMAYGLAVAARGAPEEASGSNGKAWAAHLESPSRRRDAEYQDVVKVTRPAELYDAFGCAGAIASLDTMAVAHAWSGVNEGNRRGVIKFANRVIQITELALAADVAGAAIQAAELANGLWNNGGNAIKLAQAAANFLFEWPFIPVHTAGIAQAVVGGALTAIDVGISAAAIAVDVIYRDGYVQARDDLEAFTVWTGGRGMLEQAHELGISPLMVPNPISPGPSAPVIPPAIGAPR